MSGFWDVKITDLIEVCILALTCWVVWYGPIKAIRVSREIGREDEARREEHGRKYHLFYELMRTRGIVLHPQHVMALNLVQLQFRGNETVQEAYKQYIESLRASTPTTPEENEVLSERRRDLLFALLKEIGEDLGMTFDKRDLERLSYSPQGWATDEYATRTLRDFAIQVMTGQRAIHVAPFGGPDARFPPKPDQPKIGES